MDCELLDTVLNGDCPTPFQGFNSVGRVYNWDDFDHQTTTKSNGVVQLVIKNGRQPSLIYDYSQKPFKGVKITGKQLEYSPAQDVEVILPFYAFGQVNIQNANALSGSRRKVLILEQYGVDAADKFVCIGLSKGLMTTVMSEPEANKLGFLATMTSMDCVDAQLIVDTTDAENLIFLCLNDEYEIITGLSIPTDGKVSIQIDADKTAYYKAPDGVVTSSTGGLIDIADVNTNSGNVTIAIPKVNTTFDISTSDFSGTMQFNVNSLSDINLGGCNFTSSQCDAILDVLIANGEVANSRSINFIDNLDQPSIGKQSDAIALGWDVIVN